MQSTGMVAQLSKAIGYLFLIKEQVEENEAS